MFIGLMDHRRTGFVLGQHLLQLKGSWTIGVNHAVALVKFIKSLRLSSKYLQDGIRRDTFSSAAAEGCDHRSCFVRVLHSFDAAPNIAVKLTVERLAICLLVDIRKTGEESEEGAMVSWIRPSWVETR
jgi:hypothetical protein